MCTASYHKSFSLWFNILLFNPLMWTRNYSGLSELTAHANIKIYATVLCTQHWDHKHSLMHPVHCWGLQQICSLPSGRVEQKTKRGVGSLLACPYNLECQVWLRKGTTTYVHVAVSLTWRLMWCIITNYSTCIHSRLRIIGIQFNEAHSSAN